MSDFKDLPSDLRKTKEEVPFWYFSKRGKVVDLVDKNRAQTEYKTGKFWRRVTVAEIAEGITPGHYNPIYDKGEHDINPNLVLPVISNKSTIGDVLECLLI